MSGTTGRFQRDLLILIGLSLILLALGIAGLVAGKILPGLGSLFGGVVFLYLAFRSSGRASEG